jgi:spore coat polysaccharide biosynthesis protein SpsF
MKVGFVVTARLKSSRLPMKLLAQVNGEPIMTWLLRRLRLSKSIDQIVVATSTNAQDDPLADLAEQEGVGCFRGSEDDVSSRLYQASLAFGFDYFLNMTADCPFIPQEDIPLVLETYQATDADLVTHHATAPGLYITGIKPEALRRLNERKDSEKTEYWLHYFLKTDLFRVQATKVDPALVRPYRFVLDYPEDLTFLRRVFEALGPEAYRASVRELIALLDAHPEWTKINAHCQAAMVKRTDADPNSAVRLRGP